MSPAVLDDPGGWVPCINGTTTQWWQPFFHGCQAQ